MADDARTMRGEGPIVFAQARNGVGIPAIVESLIVAWRRATAKDLGDLSRR
jgi:urease accessory protein